MMLCSPRELSRLIYQVIATKIFWAASIYKSGRGRKKRKNKDKNIENREEQKLGRKSIMNASKSCFPFSCFSPEQEKQKKPQAGEKSRRKTRNNNTQNDNPKETRKQWNLISFIEERVAPILRILIHRTLTAVIQTWFRQCNKKDRRIRERAQRTYIEPMERRNDVTESDHETDSENIMTILIKPSPLCLTFWASWPSLAQHESLSLLFVFFYWFLPFPLWTGLLQSFLASLSWRETNHSVIRALHVDREWLADYDHWPIGWYVWWDGWDQGCLHQGRYKEQERDQHALQNTTNLYKENSEEKRKTKLNKKRKEQRENRERNETRKQVVIWIS